MCTSISYSLACTFDGLLEEKLDNSCKRFAINSLGVLGYTLIALIAVVEGVARVFFDGIFYMGSKNHQDFEWQSWKSLKTTATCILCISKIVSAEGHEEFEHIFNNIT